VICQTKRKPQAKKRGKAKTGGFRGNCYEERTPFPSAWPLWRLDMSDDNGHRRQGKFAGAGLEQAADSIGKNKVSA
jgi:hypothetical protein